MSNSEIAMVSVVHRPLRVAHPIIPLYSIDAFRPFCINGSALPNHNIDHVSTNHQGELQPVKVSLPSVFDEEDEEELSAIRKGKRKAPLESI